MAIVPHDAPDGGLQFVISGKGQKHAMTDGLAGGHPGLRNRFILVHNSRNDRNVPATMARALVDLPGTKKEVSWGVYPLMDGDALYVASNGGGGYLDPLQRDPEAVARDVRDKIVSKEAAQAIYGTVIDEGLAHDVGATTALRKTFLSQRRKASAVT